MDQNDNLEKKVLIIDDDKVNIISMAHFLKPYYKVIIAKDGLLGITAAEKHLPDLILLDVVMPDMSGFDVIVKLKESEITKNIPVIFISGLINVDGNAERCMSLGAADIICKPFNESDIMEKISLFFKEK